MKSIVKCTHNDLPQLKELSHDTYRDSFAKYIGEEIMTQYLNTAFDTKTLEHELGNPDSEFYFLFYNNCLAGYFKINEHPSQTDILDPKSIEIQRLYIKKEYHNMGLGRFLMNNIINIAEKKQKLYIWLGVWEKNESAISFYKKNDFYIFGAHIFHMGEDAQTDYIMKRHVK